MVISQLDLPGRVFARRGLQFVGGTEFVKVVETSGC